MELGIIAALIILFVFLAAGIPIGFTMLLVSFTGIGLCFGFDKALSSLSFVPFSSVSDPTLIVAPMFILCGSLAFAARVSDDAFEMGNRLLGGLRGGLAMASVVASAGFAATTGSSAACAVTVGKIAIPQMRKFGYNARLACGTVAAGGLLGMMIPPSIQFVLYGVITDQSIGKLLLAGFIPGIMTAVVFCVMIWIMCTVRPDWAPPTVSYPLKEKIRYLGKGWGIVTLMVVIIGGIYSGVLNASEAGAAGAFVALLMALGRRTSWRTIVDAIADCAKTTAMLFAIIVGAFMFSHFMTRTGVVSGFSELVATMPVSPYVILLLLGILYLILGMFFDPASMCLMTLPVVFPAVMGLGFDPIWFGVFIVKLSEIAGITPPMGVNCFVIHGITPDVPLMDVFKGTAPFVVAELVVLLLIVVFPDIALFLPNMMG